MIISAIVAAAENLVIGKDGQMPWHLPGDLAYFKKTTLGHCVIMGRTSFQALGKPLVNRTNIVLTRNVGFSAEGILVVHDIDTALEEARRRGEEEVFILGGGEIYRQTQEIWHRLYLTEIHATPEGDTFFPEINLLQWREVWQEYHPADEKNQYAFTFRRYERT